MFLLQLPGDYSSLRETGRHRIQWGEWLCGLCSHPGDAMTLFTVEWRLTERRLCVYQVTGQSFTLLDTAILLCTSSYPRADGHTQQVYIPNNSGGVSVVSLEDNRLKTQPSLASVGECYSVGVLSPHTLCACDPGGVSVVRVTDDTVTAKLEKPVSARDKRAYKVAVLGNIILACYENRNLVVYENGVSSPCTVVTWLEGLQSVQNISSDGVSRFLICEGENKAVSILDVHRKLCDKINIDTDSTVEDCTVGDGKLWVGCLNGDIVVMSP